MNLGIECISCGSKEFDIVGLNEAFNIKRDVVKCYSCGLAMVYPLPGEDEITEFYTREYTSKFKSCYKEVAVINILSLFHNFFLSMRIRHRMDLLARRNISLVGKRVLEIGSGDGAFLHELKAAGAEAIGIELSKSEAAASFKRYGITPLDCPIKELSLRQKGAYDIVFSYHVLEHLRDPMAEMADVRQILKKNGLFIGEVPYTPQGLDSFSEAIRKSAFDNLHLFHFNVKSISNLLARAGFRDISVGRLGLDSITKRVYPQANIHYLHPSYEKPLAVRFFSFLEGLELYTTHALGKNTMGLQQMKDPDTEWRGPNDWISFLAGS